MFTYRGKVTRGFHVTYIHDKFINKWVSALGVITIIIIIKQNTTYVTTFCQIIILIYLCVSTLVCILLRIFDFILKYDIRGEESWIFPMKYYHYNTRSKDNNNNNSKHDIEKVKHLPFTVRWIKNRNDPAFRNSSLEEILYDVILFFVVVPSQMITMSMLMYKK